MLSPASVCLSVNRITQKLLTNLYEIFLRNGWSESIWTNRLDFGGNQDIDPDREIFLRNLSLRYWQW